VNIQPVKCVPVGNELSHSGPAKVEAGEEDEPNEMRPICLVVSVTFCGRTRVAHKGTFDAVEEENLNHHDDRCDAVEVENREALEPALAEEITDLATISMDLGSPSVTRTWCARNKDLGGIGSPAPDDALLTRAA
jgi:hypothetical protein